MRIRSKPCDCPKVRCLGCGDLFSCSQGTIWTSEQGCCSKCERGDDLSAPKVCTLCGDAQASRSDCFVPWEEALAPGVLSALKPASLCDRCLCSRFCDAHSDDAYVFCPAQGCAVELRCVSCQRKTTCREARASGLDVVGSLNLYTCEECADDRQQAAPTPVPPLPAFSDAPAVVGGGVLVVPAAALATWEKPTFQSPTATPDGTPSLGPTIMHETASFKSTASMRLLMSSTFEGV